MIEDGNDILLSKDGSFIKHRNTGKRINLRIEDGVPKFDIWIPQSNNRYAALVEEGTDNKVSTFQRLAQSL